MKDIFKSSKKRELGLLDLTFMDEVASKLLKIARISQIQFIRRVEENMSKGLEVGKRGGMYRGNE